MRKYIIHIDYREKAQEILKRKILNSIKKIGLHATEYQIEYLVSNIKTKLPTALNHRETIRIYQLTLDAYKKDLLK